jgi:TRAP-type C4-dicarboxylate transport system permease small subunit
MTPRENPISRLVEPVAGVLAIIFGYGLLIYSFALTWEILARKLLNISVRGIDEIGGFMLAIGAAVGASYSMAKRAHTRVDVFLVRMPPKVQRLLNTLALVAMATFAIFAAWRGIAVLVDTIEFLSLSPNLLQPLWMPQLAWVVGLTLFGIIASAYAAHAIWLLLKGDPALNRFYGPLTVQDEVDDEVQALKAREGKS